MIVDDEGFSGTRTAQVVGISYRQLDYWARTDLIRPSLADATGSGSRRRYSYRDLLELKVVKKLIDAGIRLESVREVFAYLREHMNTDVASAHLVIAGTDVLLCEGDDLINVVPPGPGRPQRAAAGGREGGARRGDRGPPPSGGGGRTPPEVATAVPGTVSR